MTKNNQGPTGPKKWWNIYKLNFFLSIYLLLYLLWTLPGFIPDSGNSSPTGMEPVFGRFTTWWFIDKSMFLFFLIGYIITWKNKLIGGIMLLIWFILNVIVDFWSNSLIYYDAKTGIANSLGETGLSLILGLPVLILAIFFIISGKNRVQLKNS